MRYNAWAFVAWAQVHVPFLSQSETAKLFSVTQRRVSDLLRGRISLFGLDALANMAAAAGM